MKIAVVGPSPVPFTLGGAERALNGVHRSINELTDHEAELIKVPVRETNLVEVLDAYERFSNLDLSHFDQVITMKYPSWMVDHPNKVLYLMHPLRGLYDTYHVFQQPLAPEAPSDHVFAMVHLMRQAHHRGALDEFFERWHNALDALGPDHRDFAFPGPFARLAVHWLDRIGTATSAVQRYVSMSMTVAARDDYFPRRVNPEIVYLPGELPRAEPPADPPPYFFTASRLDGPKRLDLLIDAMAHVPGDVELRIAGTGALRADLEARAAHDPRISFLGFTPNDDLPGLYAGAIAVPFIPADEDLGLVTLEAFSQATPVITCTDSGGPTEFIRDGQNGLITEPNAEAIGRAMARLAADTDFAATMGEAGRERGARVTWENVVKGLLGNAAGPLDGTDVQGPDQPGAARSKRRVVVLSTFPINDPAHGGQIRARSLYGGLSRWMPVEVVALVDFGHRSQFQTLGPSLSQFVVPRSAAHDTVGEEISAEVQVPATDLLAGTHIDLTPEYLEVLADACDGAAAVILAEPYLLPALEALDIDLPIIYDAYNVEAQLKAAAYPDTDAGQELLAKVVDTERRAVERSAQVVTCSDVDASELADGAAVGAGRFTVIPNGTAIAPERISSADRRQQSEAWRHHYWNAGSTGAVPQHLGVFFGSWHPPNLDAAQLLIDIAHELPDVLILSVGHHGMAFERRIVPENVVFTGMVTNTAKHRLLRAADVALNPMRTGSGTNLKLLEYFAVGAPVVSTPFGARGIDVVDGEHLRVAAPDRFAAAISEVLADPASAARRADAAADLVARRYSWDSLATQLASVVADIVPAPTRQ